MKKRNQAILVALAMLSSTFFTPVARAAMAKPGAICTKLGQQFHMNAKVYTCRYSGKKLTWSNGEAEFKPGSAANNNQDSQKVISDKSFLYMKRIGDKCSTEGVFGFAGGALDICKKNLVVYALPTDIPQAPNGGYKVRPSWYPSLAQQFGKTSEPTCTSSAIKFTSPVIPIDQLVSSIPYGAMIGGHVTPIDHAYLGVKSLYKDVASRTEADYVPVMAPANGVITSIGNLGSPTSIRVVIDHGCNVYTVYMVLNRLSGVLKSYSTAMSKSGANVSVNIAIKAGEVFAEQRDNPMDFNVWDGTSWLSGFINPFAYTSGDAWKPYTADPLPFFTTKIRSAMEAQMQRTTAPRFGKIDYDIAGTASGNWFLTGTMGYSGKLISEFSSAKSEIAGGQANGHNDYSWSHLAIAPHEVDSSKWIFSTGWWSNPAGDARQLLLTISSGQPTPDRLTVTSGFQVYQLLTYSKLDPVGYVSPTTTGMPPFPIGYTLNSGMTQGLVALQVNSDGSLSVEINTNLTDPSQLKTFTLAKRTYVR